MTKMKTYLYNFWEKNKHFTINRKDLISITNENKYAF